MTGFEERVGAAGWEGHGCEAGGPAESVCKGKSCKLGCLQMPQLPLCAWVVEGAVVSMDSPVLCQLEPHPRPVPGEGSCACFCLPPPEKQLPLLISTHPQVLLALGGLQSKLQWVEVAQGPAKILCPR